MSHLISPYLLFLLCILSLNTWGQYSVSTVPNLKIIDGSYISDPDNYLSPEIKTEINTLCRFVEDSTTAQIALVVLSSIEGNNAHDFGTRLFNKWKIGTEKLDNGLLILMLMQARRVEFITGNGMESILADTRCYRIQQDYMIPYFKQEKYGKGILEGIKAAATFVLENDLYPTQQTQQNYEPSYRPNQNIYTPPKRHRTGGAFFFFSYFMYLVLPLLGLYFLLLFFTLFAKDYYRKYKIIRIFESYVFCIIAPIPFLFLYFITRYIIQYWRNAPRFSAKTGALMKRLSESEENPFLKSGQIKEEYIKSVDYDVWMGQDKDDVVILAYVKMFSGFSKCPKCNFLTYQKDYSRTIVAPSYTSSGSGESKYSCKACAYSIVKRYTIAKLQDSSTTGSSSSSYSSSSSFSSSSSSSSWGGGSSSGGGAGSSW